MHKEGRAGLKGWKPVDEQAQEAYATKLNTNFPANLKQMESHILEAAMVVPYSTSATRKASAPSLPPTPLETAVQQAEALLSAICASYRKTQAT